MLYDKKQPTLADKIIEQEEERTKKILVKKRGSSRASKVKVKKVKDKKKYENKKK